MNNIVKAFKLDMVVVRKSSRTYIMFFILAVVFLLFAHSTFGISYLFLITIIITTGPFANESNTNIRKFTHSLPIAKSDLVGGRYMFMLICLLIAWVAGGIAIAMEYYLGSFTTEQVIQCILSGTLLSLTVMVQFPLYYKYGLQKGRLMSMLVYIIPILLSFSLPEIIIGMSNDSTSSPSVLSICAISFTVLLISFVISYQISRKIFLNKEL